MSVDFCAELVRDKTGSRIASLKRCGAMWHWRIGRLGGSVYLARRKPVVAAIEQAAPDANWHVNSHGNDWRRHLADRIVFDRRAAIRIAPTSILRDVAR